MQRRAFLKLGVGVVGTGAATAAGVAYADRPLFYRVERHLGMEQFPNLEVPASGARIFTGTMASRYMKAKVKWCYSLPAHQAPQAIVLSLYGKGGDQGSAFLALHLPDMAAYVGAPLAIASAFGGRDSYWHKRANGTDAHAMLVDEFVPLLRRRMGDLPLCLQGNSMGGYGVLLAAEKGARANGTNMFKGVAAASPALWENPGDTAPGAFDSAADFDANDVFADVAALRTLRVRLDCGTFDPFYQATSDLSQAMNWPHVCVFRPRAGHNMGYWRAVAPAQMRFLAEACRVPDR